MIARLTALLEDQGKTLRALATREQARPSTGKTLLQLYVLDEATWTRQRWAPAMRSTLKPALLHFGARAADELTRSDWLHYRDHVRAKQLTIRRDPVTREKTTPTAYTLNLEIKRWRTLYRRQVEEGNATTNPLIGIRAVRGAKKHRETEPTAGDVTAVQRHCDALTWAFVLLGFQRGFRASEARRLEWKQVDLDHAKITLYAWQEKTRKTQLMRITSDVVAALRAIKPDVPGRYVFPGRDGGPMHATTLWRRVRTAIDLAALEAAEGDGKVTYHDFRHGFMSRATRRHGLPIAMRLSRHRSLNAAGRYVHVNDEDLEAAYERMESDVRKAPHRAEVSEMQAEQDKNPQCK